MKTALKKKPLTTITSNLINAYPHCIKPTKHG